jgi:ParB-like chromosome segregation protein Spo0J
MATQTISYETGSMPVTLAVDGFDEALESTQETSEPKKVIKRLRDLKTSARDQLMIDPRIIVIDDAFNPRNYDLPENHAHLDALKRSIRENGTLVPLLVRYDAARQACVLVDGECRLRANLELIAEGLEIETVPTVQVSGGNESDRLITAITANTGKPLSKWELGGAFQRLYNFGWSEDKIATKSGYEERFIREAMELADAPEEVKQLLSAQAVTPSLALAELRANGSAAVQTLQAIATEHTASGKKGPAKRAKAPVKSQPAPAVQPVEAAPVDGEAFDPALDTPVTIEYEKTPIAPPVSGKRKDSKSDGDAYKIRQFVFWLEDILKDLDVADLTNPDVEYVSVKAEKLLALAHTVDRLTNNGPVNAGTSPAAF